MTVRGVPTPCAADGASLRRRSETVLPTRGAGTFRLYAYGDDNGGDEAQCLALAQGDIASPEPVLTRLHSQCLTGDVFASTRCDCGEQLEWALDAIGRAGRGVLVYTFDEGRGIGLLNKIRAYALQDQGQDTVEANHALGFAADMRDYGVGAAVLRDLGVTRVKLLTNNPDKVQALEACGIAVAERLPLEIPPRAANRGYLQTKRAKFGHWLSLAGRGEDDA